MVPAWHVEFLKQPLSFWLGTSDLQNVSEPVKCTGIKFDPAGDVFTCYVPLKFTDVAFRHLAENPVLALVVTQLHSFESYQYKGDYISQRPCTVDEVEYQRVYMEAFTDILGTFGHSKTGMYNIYFVPPFVALTLKVREVFDQSPRNGTGGQVA